MASPVSPPNPTGGVVTHADPEPWEFQPYIDSADSFNCFRIFMSFPPPRKIQDVATVTRRAIGTIRNWARDCLWADRALAWDRHCHDIIVKETEASSRRTAVQVADRHRELTDKMLATVEIELAKIHGQSVENANAVLAPRDLTRMLKEAAHLDRLAANLPTEISGTGLDFSGFSDAELAEFDRLMSKAKQAK